MTKEQAGNIIKAMSTDKNAYVRDCNARASKEDGKIIGAEYMWQKLHDILALEVNSQDPETEDDILKAIMDDCNNRTGCKGCKYLNTDTVRCKLVGVPSEWEFV